VRNGVYDQRPTHLPNRLRHPIWMYVAVYVQAGLEVLDQPVESREPAVGKVVLFA